ASREGGVPAVEGRRVGDRPGDDAVDARVKRRASRDGAGDLGGLEDGAAGELDEVGQLEVERAVVVDGDARRVGKLAAQNLADVAENELGATTFKHSEGEDAGADRLVGGV